MMTLPEPATVTAHQPRERAVPCGGCGRPTWEVHAVCTTCGPTTCDRCFPTTGHP